MPDKAAWSGIERALGPGLIFSGSAIGISHLVQSTRAGAMFGLALVGFIVLVNVLKYPAFRFALDYSHTTGRSLISGYRRLGLWPAVLFCASTFPMQPIGMAAICATTAALLAALIGLDASVAVIATLATAVSVLLLVLGGYAWLDRLNKLLMAVLVATTLATTIVILPQIDWASATSFDVFAQPATLLFLIPLAGFMPSPTSQSVALSMWVLKSRSPEVTTRPNLSEMRFGFFGSYVLSIAMALCFCLMGAGVLHASQAEMASDAVGFATQVIGLYHAAFGPFFATLAAIAAVCVMATTMLAGFDGTARMWSAAIAEVRDEPGQTERAYIPCLFVLAAATVFILFFVMNAFAAFIDIVTTVFFVASPIVALLNHLLITRPDVRAEARPSALLVNLSLAGIVGMSALSAAYFWFT